MKNSNKRPGVPITDIEKINFDKELVIKALSKPENIAKIMEVNQRIAKELGLGTDENSTITPNTAVVDKNEEVQSQHVNIDNEQKI